MANKCCKVFSTCIKSLRGLCKRKTKSPVKKSNKIGTNFYDSEYSSGEDESEFEVPFSQLDGDDKAMRCEFLWHTAYLRAHGGAIILRKFTEVHSNILIFGTTKHINYDPN